MRHLAAIFLICLSGAVLAQSSQSYRLEGAKLNAGEQSSGSLGLVSASYHMSLLTVGQTLTAPALHGSTYSMDVGFARSYPPPGEVQLLVVLGDKTTLSWARERSAGTYRVYGGDLRTLPSDYGVCQASDVVIQQAQFEDEPDVGRGFFYLVTAQNTLLEEGTKGYDSAGRYRANPVPCP